MPSNKDYSELEEEIRTKRSLPYSLTVEKIEGDKIFTHNIWGNIVVYLRKKDGTYDIA